jgi:hypothetical protein
VRPIRRTARSEHTIRIYEETMTGPDAVILMDTLRTKSFRRQNKTYEPTIASNDAPVPGGNTANSIVSAKR